MTTSGLECYHDSTSIWTPDEHQQMHRVTYKPGWSIELANFQRQLVIEARVRDSRTLKEREGCVFQPDAAGLVPLLGSIALPSTWETDKLERRLIHIWNAIILFERHESAEFFRFDGELVYPPHAPGVDLTNSGPPSKLGRIRRLVVGDY